MRENKTIKKHRHHLALTLLYSLVVFLLNFIAMTVAGGMVYVMVQNGTIQPLPEKTSNAFRILLFMVLFSNVVGLILTLATNKIMLGPIKELIDRMNQLASGDFRVRLSFHSLLDRHPTAEELTKSFNTMAHELESTEMLRSDFINNFSHEFKTPIVSIAGFAKLLKKGNLSEEQKAEYIDIIEKESLRLSKMATNVLNLTRVENQAILTEVSEFNLSEQIRYCLLLLIDKLEAKEIELNMEFGEHKITANEELLKQVWINLLDNAVKFSPDGGMIEIRIKESEDTVTVHITNLGDTIPKDKQSKIFGKFYQADESHASEGNGIGLAIVKRVAELHGGTVEVKSEYNVTMFTVELPKTSCSS